jgi:hypothetical protein
MYKLRITLREGSVSDDSQLIELSVKKDAINKRLFFGRIDLKELIDWININKLKIKEVDFPIDRLNGESLAKSISHFYESIEEENEENEGVIDEIFDYRTCHCLRFGARGVEFPEIHIGKVGNEYEISLFNDECEWKYAIDINDFFENLYI